MALKNDIVINLSDGGIGRLPANDDHITGIIFQGTKPAGFGTDDIKTVYSLAEAVSYGITEALYPVEYYQIGEFFRLCQKFGTNARLDVGIYTISTGTYAGTQVATMQRAALGKIRRIGVFLIDPFASAFVTDTGAVCDTLNGENMPVSVYIAADFANFTSPTDLRALDEKFVSVVIGMDGDGTGYDLSVSKSYAVAALGALLACRASGLQSDNAGWVAKYDITSGTEYQVLRLADGSLVSAQTQAKIDELNDKGYTLLVPRYVSGAYFYDSPTASLATSDYAYTEIVETVAKAKRIILRTLAPSQNGTIFVDPQTGYIDDVTISYYEKLIDDAIKAEMQQSGAQEISGFKATINPTQNVNSTSKVVISAKIVSNAVGRKWEVNLGFAPFI